MFWPAILVAPLGATLGGALTWWMGYGAEQAYEHVTHKRGNAKAAALARALRPEGLPAVVAADRRRPALCRRLLAEAAVLAVRRLHGDRQVRPLPRDDRRLLWFFPGQYTP